MMNPSELRIGVLVFVDNPKYHPKLKGIPLEVTGINERLGEDRELTYCVSLKHINQKPNTYYDTYSQLLKFIKPIPTSSEWLRKLAFGKAVTRKTISKTPLDIVFGLP